MTNGTCVCSSCGATKVKVWNGEFKGSSREKRFVDDKGNAWLGKRCVDCKNKIYAQHRGYPDKPIEQNIIRKCRCCNTALPITRYFNCEICVLPGESDYSNEY